MSLVFFKDSRNYISNYTVLFLLLQQMKRTLLIFLAIFYFGISQGATVYLHYCMGEIVQTGMTKSENASCEFCGMTTKEGKEKSCCKKEIKQLTVNDAQKMAVSHFQFEQAPIIVLKSFIWDANYHALPIQLGRASLSNAPPEWESIPVFVRNCTYRI